MCLDDLGRSSGQLLGRACAATSGVTDPPLLYRHLLICAGATLNLRICYELPYSVYCMLHMSEVLRQYCRGAGMVLEGVAARTGQRSLRL